MNPHYYNEWDDYAAQWLRNLIAEGRLPPGDVDTRSIADVNAGDLDGYVQCHFFAGIGGWALAARLAGWPIDRELWTGSCPCQPFSVAGKQRGADDERHLWPHQLRLLRARRPAVWMGEQVAAAVGAHWLDGVLADLEGVGYAARAAVVPACAVDAPHRRDRIWICAGDRVVGDGVGARLEGHARHGADAAGRAIAHRSVAEASGDGALVDADSAGSCARIGNGEAAGHGTSVATTGGASAWRDHRWILGHDGKARRVEPSIQLLAHGVPARVGRLRAYGNAIVPALAAEVIRAWMECAP